MSIITISRQDGSLGDEIAVRLSQRMNMQLILRDRVISEWMAEVANKYQLHMLSESPRFYLSEFKDGMSFKVYIEKILIKFAEMTPSVIVGMGAQIIFSDHPDALRVRIIASEQTRTERLRKKYGLTGNEAEKLVQQGDKKHRRYTSVLYGVEWTEMFNYDLVMNTDNLSVEQCVEIIVHHIETKSLLSSQSFSDDDENNISQKDYQAIHFKHPAEEEFARILDMYGIEWEYEPRTFPVQWDAEGNVTMAFSPDFYLTKFDTYIEITTMEQKYVTIKNKKVKRLRELYPDININIVYKKDFHTLLKRFGFSGEDEINEFNRS